MSTVLIVDDDPDIRELLHTLVVGEGYDALLASNGLEALALARTHQPQLILLDMMLPQLDGVGVWYGLQRDPRTALIPVVVITAFPGDMQRFPSGTIVTVTIKPFSMAAMRRAVHRILDAPENNQAS